MGFSILGKLELETGKSRRKARREIIVFWQLAGLASCPKKILPLGDLSTVRVTRETAEMSQYEGLGGPYYYYLLPPRENNNSSVHWKVEHSQGY